MFNLYPYTDFHELNLDMILRMMKDLHKEWTDFEAVNKITNAGAWDITKQYQAWTIVSDNNTGYISLKPVPVGVAITNTEYWGVIADYNILITDLRIYVDKYMGVRRSRNVLLIGDSYIRGDQATTDTIESVLASGLKAATFNYSYGGSGFYANPGHTFIEQLQGAIADDNLDKTIITDVLIGGGYNDALSLGENDYLTAMLSIVSLIETNMPDAQIWFAPMFWTNTTYTIDWANKHKNMVNAAIKTGKNVYADCNILLYRKDSSYISGDGVHPTSLGYKVIGDYLSEWMNGSYLSPEYENSINVTLEGGEPGTLFYKIKNGMVFTKLYFYSAGAYGVDQVILASANMPDLIKPSQALPMTGSSRAMSNEAINVLIGGDIHSVAPIPVNANITLTASYPFTPYIY